MPLLDTWAELAKKTPADPSGAWFDTFVARAKEGIVASDTASATTEAFKLLEQSKAELAHLGEYGLVLTMTHLAAGRWDKAVEYYLANYATLDELIDASSMSNEAVLKAHQQAIHRRNQALQILMSIGVFAAKYVLPLLIAAL